MMSSGAEKRTYIESLILAYKSGSYEVAEELAYRIKTENPNNLIAWKILASAQQKLGKVKDSVNSNLEAIRLFPDDPELHNNLGNSLRLLGRYEESEQRFAYAVQLQPDFSTAYNNLGLTLDDIGKHDKAQRAYRSALQLSPNYINAYQNLAVSLLMQRKLDLAVEVFNQVLAINPRNLDAITNLASIYRQKGDPNKALELLSISNINQFPTANYVRGLVYLDLCNKDDAQNCFSRALAVKDLISGRCATQLAILAYIENQAEKCKAYIELAKNKFIRRTESIKNDFVYLGFLEKLLKSNRVVNTKVPNCELSTLYCIGESHSLSYAGLEIAIGRASVLCSSEWIEGCKQWHLGNANQNMYKVRLENIINKIPIASKILFAFGEIDCRHDGGIAKQIIRNPAASVGSIIYKTISNYLDWIESKTHGKGFEIIISGVPAPNININDLSILSPSVFLGMICDFNKILMRESLKRNYKFLDVYSLSKNTSGVSTGKWHIDEIHLSPNAILEAFDKHLITCSTPRAIALALKSDQMSDEAKNQLANVQLTDQEIQRLQVRLAIAQTARNTYAQALNAALATASDTIKFN